MNRFIFLIIVLITFSCGEKQNETKIEVVKEKIIKEFGFTLNNFNVKKDTIESGDSFGLILEKNNLFYPKIYNIVQETKKVFDIRKINVGRPYTILSSKDSLNKPLVFIYQPNAVDYLVVSLGDSLWAEKKQKEIKLKEFEAMGSIKSSLAETMQELNLSPLLTNELSEIYAWNIDFFRLEKGDNFKIQYTSRYVDDSIYIGLNRIHNAFFEHRGKPLYAFKFSSDSLGKLSGYYDENANNLKRAFLKAPVKFSRISSRYNLNRRIKYYGFKLRPHRGTDFAAPVGTPILATADGVVTKSERRGGNGNYVKIRHNGTYETQYLHMKARNVKVGQHVSQGDVIGWIGMTGNTSGPHVCYRFWKNGKEVDPFKEDTPFSQPLPKELHEQYFANLLPIKEELDCIMF